MMGQHRLLTAARESIECHRLLSAEDKVVIGLSGGADSVALLCALKKLGYECVAAHCNFHLRGEESDRDMNHARSIASKLGVKFRSIDFNVEAEIAKSPHPLSTEMACRNLRYDWFEKIRQEEKASAIAVAHHRSDNVETFLLNLFRGSGLSGLRGMLPINDRHIIRPLLNASRGDIEDFLTTEGLGFVNDSTNSQNDYRRNRIRNRIVPAIEQEFPDAVTGMLKTIAHLYETEQFLKQAVEEKRDIYQDDSGQIDVRKLKESEPSAAYLLYSWLKKDGLSRTQTDSIIQSSESSGLTFKGRDETFLLNRGILRPTGRLDLPEDFGKLYSVTRVEGNRLPSVRNNMEIYLDMSVLDEENISVRRWSKGDRIAPFGMRGSKMVSDVFSDAKVPVDAKCSWPIVAAGEKILWVTGLRAGRLYSVGPQTKSYLIVRYTGPELPGMQLTDRMNEPGEE